MSRSDVASALSSASSLATLLVAAGGPMGVVAGVAAIALKAGAVIAAAGGDPVTEIERILSSDPKRSEIHDGWEALIRSTFAVDDEAIGPPDTQSSPVAADSVPDAAPTEPSDTVYDDEDIG